MGKERHTAALVVGIVAGGAAGMAYGWLNVPGRGADARAAVGEIWNDMLELSAEAIADADNRVRSRLTGEEPAWTLPMVDRRPALATAADDVEAATASGASDGVEGGVEPADA
ncbi:MAG TPA: hypothetical protein VFI22_19590 [Thermomicrobiales bacterium]|nr:hypothetical protein [Thermomicrobiales bacterium]